MSKFSVARQRLGAEPSTRKMLTRAFEVDQVIHMSGDRIRSETLRIRAATPRAEIARGISRARVRDAAYGARELHGM
jgi:hypothetical protein